MHIPDGILPVSTAVSGFVAAGGVAWFSLRRIERTHTDPRKGVPKASLLTAVFFMASLIHIPVPPASVHLVLSGLMGVVLGWYAFPAILVGLFLQAVMFQHGGLTALGVNGCIIGVPALLAHQIFGLRTLLGERHRALGAAALGFTAAFAAVALGALAAALLIVSAVPSYLDAAVERTAVIGLLLAHMPLGLIEGMFTAMVVLFLLRVQPGLLEERI